MVELDPNTEYVTVSKSELAEITEEVDDVRENDIRGLSHRLHPSIVRVGAYPALKSLCSRMSGDVKVELQLDDAAKALEPIGASPIPEPVRLAVFRIAELAIGNTIKHAEATRCDVSWSYFPSRQALVLSVEDDGVGFDQGTMSSSGLGIVNIQDYTDAIDGQAVLKSEPGWGTTLTVKIPFAHESGVEGMSDATAATGVLKHFKHDEQQKAA
jgi:signal transduction histidine kinase